MKKILIILLVGAALVGLYMWFKKMGAQYVAGNTATITSAAVLNKNGVMQMTNSDGAPVFPTVTAATRLQNITS